MPHDDYDFVLSRQLDEERENQLNSIRKLKWIPYRYASLYHREERERKAGEILSLQKINKVTC
jgi:hypothetical protein